LAIRRALVDRDGIICAWIHGVASRHTRTGDPQGPEREAAVAELREAASPRHDGRGVRADLLSRECGLFTGIAAGQKEDQLGWWRRAQMLAMAGLCAEAAGDQLDSDLVTEWTAEGTARA